jgi:hypothetical protein
MLPLNETNVQNNKYAIIMLVHAIQHIFTGFALIFHMIRPGRKKIRNLNGYEPI